jgi:predicted nucleic acid-binding protein
LTGICCDANIVVSIILGNASPETRQHWDSWRETGTRLFAPTLFRYEVTNALHRHTRAFGYADTAADRLIEKALSAPVEILEPDFLHMRSARIARAFNRPASYDSAYLALAEYFNTEFWTLDARLHNAVSHHLPWVRIASV